ncbi:hypothetical protein [Brachybacterium paraconglomeratum]|uniref:hypothetical protein n=1 Tax=Brachybacterium paraconglomeratum TaxID=173362 RepID=UPI00223A6B78|nr:hypothetical protein [Brachybacterium paraconglomeratum]MCT1436745.1 hypothetical protein [Brachybacterium paraconglomeratum]
MSPDRTTRTAEPGTTPRTALLLVDLQEAFFEAPGLAGARADVLAAVGRSRTELARPGPRSCW